MTVSSFLQSFEEKVANVSLAFELMMDGGLPQPKVKNTREKKHNLLIFCLPGPAGRYCQSRSEVNPPRPLQSLHQVQASQLNALRDHLNPWFPPYNKNMFWPTLNRLWKSIAVWTNMWLTYAISKSRCVHPMKNYFYISSFLLTTTTS